MQTGTYVVCLDCGTEFAYDWKKMRVLSPNEQKPFTHARVEVEANGSRAKGEVRAMKKQWFRAVESTFLVFSYFWYNTSIHSVVARILS